MSATPENHMNGERIIRAVRHVGEVLVIRFDKPFVPPSERAAYEQLAYGTGCSVLLLPKGRSLESLDTEQMRAAGWVRAEE